MKSEYINELKNMLENKNYKLKSFQVYGDEAIVYFVPKKRKQELNFLNKPKTIKLNIILRYCIDFFMKYIYNILI